MCFEINGFYLALKETNVEKIDRFWLIIDKLV
jgi:hypothetical protein